jgi:formylglycine-generating enzyme required for sulfatase activity
MRRLLIAGVVVVVVFASCGKDDQPTPPAPTGSCCAVQGACTVTQEAACAGTWAEAGVCDPNPCPPPVPPDMILIPAGSFTMGSPASEPGRSSYGNRETQHQVTLTRPYYLCDHEVTQAEWYAVMQTRPSRLTGDNLPVEQVSWFDAIEYCNQRSVDESLAPVYTLSEVDTSGGHIMDAIVSWIRDANGYRLPTEAEWEYACRAGSTSAFSNGPIIAVIGYDCSDDANLDLVGWYCGNALNTTHDAGGKVANAWGLKDMHGNVDEWCWDRYGDYPAGPVSDPAGPSWGGNRVFRGGGWKHTAQYCRSAGRLYYTPGSREFPIGPRVARTALSSR